MSSFILSVVRGDDLQNWVKVNAVGQLKSIPADSWRAYLAANSGTGQTMHDLESSFTKSAGATGSTLYDKWDDYLGRVLGVTGGKAGEKARNKYK
jgi:hypothetical protein